MPDLAAAQGGSVAGSRAAAGLEESLWLCPIEDRRLLDSAREGMVKDSPSAAICSWSTTRAGCSAKVRPRSRATWRRFLIGWARAPKAGGHGSRSSPKAGSSAASSRPPWTACGVCQPDGRAPLGQSGPMPGAITRTSGRSWTRPWLGVRVFPLSRRRCCVRPTIHIDWADAEGPIPSCSRQLDPRDRAALRTPPVVRAGDETSGPRLSCMSFAFFSIRATDALGPGLAMHVLRVCPSRFLRVTERPAPAVMHVLRVLRVHAFSRSSR